MTSPTRIFLTAAGIVAAAAVFQPALHAQGFGGRFSGELPERRPEGDFLAEAARAVNDAFSVMQAEADTENIRLWGYGASDGLFHLFASNRKHTYALARILLKKRAVFKQLLSGGFVIPPTMEETADGGTRLQVKLPPMGTVSMTLKI